MIPILYNDTETAFSGIGLGGLGKATACRVKRQLNGVYELEMQYPILGRRFRDLRPRNIILASVGPDAQAQPFRIYKTRLNLMLRKSVYARHVAYDLMGCPLPPFDATGLQAALGAVAGSTQAHGFPFVIRADFASDAKCSIAAPRSVWAMLGGQRGSLLDVYGGEWDFDRWNLTLRQRMGADNGLMIRYGKNLLTLEQEEDTASTWTAVYPYWLSADNETVVTLPERMISTGEFDYTRVLVWDASAEFQEAPTVEQLRSRTVRYISSNRVGDIGVSLDAEWVPLDQTEEYKDRRFPSAVHLGDTVAIEYPGAADPTTGTPTDFVRAAARVVEYVWLPLQDKYEYVRVGAKRSNFVSVVAQAAKDLSWVLSKVKR